MFGHLKHRIEYDVKRRQQMAGYEYDCGLFEPVIVQILNDVILQRLAVDQVTSDANR